MLVRTVRYVHHKRDHRTAVPIHRYRSHKNEQRWPRSSKRRRRPPPPPVPSSSTRSTTTWCTIPSWITTGRSWPRPHRVRFYLCEGNVFIVFVCVLGWAVWSDTRYLERLLAKLKSVSPAYLFGLVPGTFAVGTGIGIASVVCSHRRSCQRNENFGRHSFWTRLLSLGDVLSLNRTKLTCC